jgi:hypothetical protein
VNVRGHHPAKPVKAATKTTHGFKKKTGRYIGIKTRSRPYDGLLIHLPDLVTCPACGEQSNDIVYCLACGRTWMAVCGHGSELEEDGHTGVNIAELRRVKGDGELHVIPLVFTTRED